ncbi:oligosaccharide translocation protein RFT1 [Nannizzia gypsea CBS 118893]|uniref:Man(5)GlcNAc(2)-PP-dolichol translocation protein RFT1 n=1 Tax=Arthroderma gypseum (strain ATCC MYA-4604 / CBS 118893) TaxID=535722 RepID=E5QZ35_ARTGP|nr:oligosaccharide translocation protein RFT1 [Nannizzia gypsea CBS 118893]EFQ98944.1 oligosaccharide translocation protein RFT1 [Nannizzia gypsea CBS 118893]
MAPGSRLALGPIYLIAIQVVSRGLTFLANQILLRHITPYAFGLASQIELYSITVLFFSRESIRLAAQRQPAQATRASDTDATDQRPKNAKNQEECTASQAVVNISYVPIALGLPMAYVLGTLYLNLGQSDNTLGHIERISFLIVQLATVLELLSEPLFAVVQQRMLYGTRAKVEMISSVARAFFSCASVLIISRSYGNAGILPIALGQLGYATFLLAGYFVAAKPLAQKLGFHLYPVRIGNVNHANFVFSFIPQRLLTLSMNLYMQSVAKHILTQSDSVILASLASLEIQGQYALASNYGGLIARMVFQPIEEYSRNLFSKLLGIREGGCAVDKSVKAVKSQFINILRGYGVLCVAIGAVGPAAVPLAIKLIIGSHWDSPETQQVLSSYCYYIPFLAVNGITEAFVSAAATNSELRQQTKWMGILSAVFVVAAYVFLKITESGVYGLLWANLVNMAARIIWSSFFIMRFFENHDNKLHVREVLPSLGVCITGAIGWLSLRYTSVPGGLDLENLIKVATTGICVGFSM